MLNKRLRFWEGHPDAGTHLQGRGCFTVLESGSAGCLDLSRAGPSVSGHRLVLSRPLHGSVPNNALYCISDGHTNRIRLAGEHVHGLDPGRFLPAKRCTQLGVMQSRSQR